MQLCMAVICYTLKCVLGKRVTSHSLYCLTSSAHKPGNPFTLQEYFGFHICKGSHPDLHVSFECMYNFEKRFIAGGHPKAFIYVLLI